MIVIALSYVALIGASGRRMKRPTCEVSASDRSDIMHGPVLTDIHYKSDWLGHSFAREQIPYTVRLRSS